MDGEFEGFGGVSTELGQEGVMYRPPTMGPVGIALLPPEPNCHLIRAAVGPGVVGD